jgi:hypothetical protein
MNVLAYANRVANRIVSESRFDVMVLAKPYGDRVELTYLEHDVPQRVSAKRDAFNHGWKPSTNRHVGQATASRLDALQAFYSSAESNGAEVSPFDAECNGSIRWAIAERKAR